MCELLANFARLKEKAGFVEIEANCKYQAHLPRYLSVLQHSGKAFPCAGICCFDHRFGVDKRSTTQLSTFTISKFNVLHDPPHKIT